MSLQQNVQQQNQVSFEKMLATAQHFRANGVAIGIRKFLAGHGIDVDRSAIIWGHSDKYMLGFEFGLEGTLVTVDKKIFHFELELNSTLTEVVTVYEFADVTAEQNMSENNRGTGKGDGALAVDVLAALNCG